MKQLCIYDQFPYVDEDCFIVNNLTFSKLFYSIVQPPVPIKESNYQTCTDYSLLMVCLNSERSYFDKIKHWGKWVITHVFFGFLNNVFNNASWKQRVIFEFLFD